MERRAFIGAVAGTLLAAPLAAEAQPAGKVYRIGCIPAGPLPSRMHQWEAFRQRLRDLGYVEGQNVVLEVRAPAREGALFDGLVADLIRLNVDVIVASGIAAILAAKRATSTIPIVMSPGSDPVGLGLVASLAQPGGNVTGVSIMVEEMNAKRLHSCARSCPRRHG